MTKSILLYNLFRDDYMDFNYLLNEKIDYNNLQDYGFKKVNESYQYVCDIDNSNLSLLITIGDKVNVNIIDNDFNDEHLPFKTKMSGEYSAKIEEYVKGKILDIKDKCVLKNKLVNEIKSYVNEKDNVELVYPWSDTPDACTLKVKGKWFGLIMNVKYKVLGVDSLELVDIINLKLEPSEIEELIDDKLYFKAYHMNKKYWITILLNSKMDKDKLFELIDKSYNIVSSMIK